MEGKFHFAIDRGGTFTDIWCLLPDGSTRQLKLLSEDPKNYQDAPREGIRRIMEQFLNKPLPASVPIDPSWIAWVRMGTTVATNALLERKGERTALLVTKGFKDLLYIGNQARPSIFDLKICMPECLYEKVIEVDERVVIHDNVKQVSHRDPQPRLDTAVTGEQVAIWKELDTEKLRKDLLKVYSDGIRSIAVVLLHSYMYDKHEVMVRAIAEEVGFTQVSLSSVIMPMCRAVPRGHTACADAYLTPSIKSYVTGFASGFAGGLTNLNVMFMQSDGGLTSARMFSGAKAMLSGPAGGVVGYATTSYQPETKVPVIGFDMGGTSTDVSRYAGSYEHVMESYTAGITVQAPQLDINTVAAGGGSRLFFRSGMFVVGPESAGADPGPVCYWKGGHLTITDANLMLNRILPEHFPSIFGETQDQPLDREATMKAFQVLTDEINDYMACQGNGEKHFTKEEVAIGFIDVANETMCRPIRALTTGKGYDTSKHVLSCFGGAGGQHACAIAASLGMKQVIIHKYAGILSAYGMALADVVSEHQQPFASAYTRENFDRVQAEVSALKLATCKELLNQGFSSDCIDYEVYLNLRYKGTDCALMCSPPTSDDKLHGTQPMTYDGFLSTFLFKYETEFGFTIADREIIVDDIRVRGVGKCISPEEPDLSVDSDSVLLPAKVIPCYFGNSYHDTSLYLFRDLKPGQILSGPAIIIDANSTILVEPQCKASITLKGDIHIEVHSLSSVSIGQELDPIQLAIFSHRFMSIAEQMGRVLQRTSISTNIKERLDFSCAVFGPEGGLVANAPHIPVHLGAMQETVQYQIRMLGDEIKRGDVLLSNHPKAGGSHLPDLTVITPVFRPEDDKSRPVFFVASRGHHADIGGKTPGSMPPNSTSIYEEGAVFKTFKLVKEGEFQEKEVTEALNAPAQHPGCTGTRNLSDNLSDLRAQVAANQKGIKLITSLIEEYDLPLVQAYMAHIQHNAEEAVRDMLKEVAAETMQTLGTNILRAEDFMDDGSKIQLTVSLDSAKGTAVFDFDGTARQVVGNCNAPRAVTLSAVIYSLRCMVGRDIPLNQGCLKPVTVIIPPGCILDPEEDAAVVGGNVLTSQRIVDVIFKAFNVCAASQGCMNNVTFGDGSTGYYETVAGGAGAGPGWQGRSGVHTHMTNTRITDPEIVERRYSVLVSKFYLNEGSGGQGLYRGGDGVLRELTFCKEMVLSILTERRVFSPYGLQGGLDGRKGQNLLIKKDGAVIELGGKYGCPVYPGDTLHMETPGGGGWGEPGDVEIKEDKSCGLQQRGSVYTYRRLQESA
ncbi:5-oxoprolinase-like [Watersipora subatra]|uniref:5-oxoprolinase-like n=1 Tax=Watersipora subatra TaxID=2589382 RepID=UPI00355B02E8